MCTLDAFSVVRFNRLENMLVVYLLRLSTSYPSSSAEINAQFILLPIVALLLGYKADKPLLAPNFKFLARNLNYFSNFRVGSKHGKTSACTEQGFEPSRNQKSSILNCDVISKIVQYKMNFFFVKLSNRSVRLHEDPRRKAR